MPATYPFEAESGEIIEVSAGSFAEAEAEARLRAGGPVRFRSRLPADQKEKVAPIGRLPIVTVPGRGSYRERRQYAIKDAAYWALRAAVDRIYYYIGRPDRQQATDVSEAWTDAFNRMALYGSTDASIFITHLDYVSKYEYDYWSDTERAEIRAQVLAAFDARLKAHRETAKRQAAGLF